MSETHDEDLAAIEEHMIELETKLSFQDDALLKLENRVVEQDKQIHRLITEMAELRGQLKNQNDQLVGPQSEEPPPPHY